MKSILASFILSVFSQFAAAADPAEWVQIAGSTFHIKKGSFTKPNGMRGGSVVILNEVPGSNPFFYTAEVSVSYCSAGYGQINNRSLGGKPLITNDFVFGGGTIASEMAQIICALMGIST